ncbi:hypothetical protein [Thermomonospora amylolytica]|uniref:hypothetical protein n=1 Tax=Thermomonospora amylolytica TaxID=1411117 RepID=UPI000E6D0F1C|nr:hypothetical protein [Thermomonospora amylolytica]
MTDQPPGPARGPLPYDERRCEELTLKLGRILAQIAPEGWRRIDLKILMTVGISDVSLTVVMRDGSSPEVQPVRELTEIAAELRARMYRPGRGTWFGMRYMMDPPGAYWVSYNTDYDPMWSPPLPPGAYEQDLAAFPRDEQHIPDWLRAELRRSPAHDG